MGQTKLQPRTPSALPRTVAATINYVGPMTERPRYYANDHSRDVLRLDPRVVAITDVRSLRVAPSLGHEGFQMVEHKSSMSDFSDPEQVSRLGHGEVEKLIFDLSGADRVVVTPRAILRYGEQSPNVGKSDNSWPARFAHIDITDATARQFVDASGIRNEGRPIRRHAYFNIWRAISPPPQDIPLAVVDARSVELHDLVEADAVFDQSGKPEWSFVSWLIGVNPRHRWSYFSNMTRDEVLVFKTNDTDPEQPHAVPHSAFNDPSCPAGVPTRASIEMRAAAYWFA
jgi:hypothetical protein